MDVHDWFEDNHITTKLEEMVRDLKGSHPEDSGFDIFLKGIRDIINEAHHYPRVGSLLIRAILDPGEELSLNAMIRASFYAVLEGDFELRKVEYVEGVDKVVVEYGGAEG